MTRREIELRERVGRGRVDELSPPVDHEDRRMLDRQGLQPVKLVETAGADKAKEKAKQAPAKPPARKKAAKADEARARPAARARRAAKAEEQGVSLEQLVSQGKPMTKAARPWTKPRTTADCFFTGLFHSQADAGSESCSDQRTERLAGSLG